MKIEDLKLICVKDKISNGYTVFINKFPEIIIQVDKLEKIPEVMCNVLYDVLLNEFNKNLYNIIDIK